MLTAGTRLTVRCSVESAAAVASCAPDLTIITVCRATVR